MCLKVIIKQTVTSSISQLCISSTVLCFATSLSTPPTTSTLRDGKEGVDESEEGGD